MTKESVVSKIEKLMKRTAENGASEAEVETAMKMAQKLMDDHQIEMAELYANDSKSMGIDDINEEVVRAHCRHDKWEKVLLAVITKVTGAKGYLTTKHIVNPKTGKLQKRFLFVVYGHKDDTLAAKALYAELMVVIRVMAVATLGPWRQPHFHYAEGFCSGLWAKLDEEEKELKAKASENVRTLVCAKDALVRQYAQDKLKLGTARSGRGDKSRHGGAFNAGRADGAAYNLNRNTKVGNGSKKLT